MRTMAFWLRPLASDMVRVLQCVACLGRFSKVRVMTSSTLASVSLRGWPERGRSPKAPKPPVRKRSRQVPTVCPVTPSRAATAWLLRPAAHSRTMRARCAVRGSVLGRRASRRSWLVSSSLKTTGSIGRPVRIPTF